MPLATPGRFGLPTLLVLTALATLAPRAAAQAGPPAAAQADSAAVVSARLGPELSAAERAYFGLFPSVAGFASARLVPAEGGLRVEVARTGGRADTALVLGPAAARALVGFVETFEDYPDAIQNPNWSQGFPVNVYVPVPYVGRDRRVGVHMASGFYQDQLLYATDSLLVLAPAVRPRDPSLAGVYAVRLGEVEEVSLEDRVRRGSRERFPLLGAALGAAAMGVEALAQEGGRPADELAVNAVIGAGIGYALVSIAGQLRERRQPPRAMVDELSAWAHYSASRPPGFPSDDELEALAERPRPSPRPVPRARRHEWISVGLQANQENAAGPYQLSVDTREEATRRLVDGVSLGERPSVRPPYSLSVAVRPITWARLGLHAGPQREAQGVDLLEELSTVETGPVRGYAELILPLLRVGRGRIEVAAGAGVESFEQAVELTTPSRFVSGRTNAALREPFSYAYTGSGTSVYPQVTVEAYSSARSSFYLQWSWHRYPSIEVEEFGVFYFNDPSVQAYRVEAHTVEFKHWQVGFGTRFHF